MHLFCEAKPNTSKEYFYSLAYRFLGRQSIGISVDSFVAQVEEFVVGMIPGADISSRLLLSLFSVTHERYTGQKSLKELIFLFEDLMMDRNLIKDTLNFISRLYAVDIRLNVEELIILFCSIKGLNTAEFDRLRISKSSVLNTLLNYLQHNKFAVFKLFNALNNTQDRDNFALFLAEFEKAPFGKRDFSSQFSFTEVERVINQSQDLNNQSIYSWDYRKKLMELFLFVNEIGVRLPAYYGKAAKDLTNQEIASFFADLKACRVGESAFQRRLLALGLIREAMYRATGEFPYSTQIIALLDVMLHDGDVLSNIDTGQGKSLIDAMKAALLWLESSLVVQYLLKENTDYVIPEGYEKKIVNGVACHTKVAKILMNDDKVSPDSVFGNGMQQLLYAHLNKKAGRTDFVIEPQHSTIISCINKNLIDYYRKKRGFIWASSGSLGSKAEIQEQYSKYRFESSKNESHQQNRVVFYPIERYADEDKQFTALIQQLTALTPDSTCPPNLVFCKDIDAAVRLFNRLKAANPKNFPIQLYTGLGKEENIIDEASKPGMITITTGAFSRNTNIHYDHIAGLEVWHACWDSARRLVQKGGRTGRQGSNGGVHFVLNDAGLANQNLEELSQQIDDLAAREREISERCYDVIGALLARIDYVPDASFKRGTKAKFIKEVWSHFSAEIETQYRESRQEPDFSYPDIAQYVLGLLGRKERV